MARRYVILIADAALATAGRPSNVVWKGPSVAVDQSTVQAVITQFLQRANKAHDGIAADTRLYGEGLELDSLEAAELSAMLEDEFGTDPFSAGGELPESIGDILSFYVA